MVTINRLSGLFNCMWACVRLESEALSFEVHIFVTNIHACRCTYTVYRLCYCIKEIHVLS